jgi:SAM-dependent methyltransferase
MPFKSKSFDLVTSFGVLHHIPNVSFVIQEISRCTKDGGWFLLREPIVSMGDWRKKRPSLTKRERGIPLPLLRKIIKKNNFEIIAENKCIFPLIPMFGNTLKIQAYNSELLVKLDKITSNLFSWNNIYHPKNTLQKLRPCSVFFVLRKKT